ncbi:MAG: NUDIX domain-containing protein [Phycisphaerae bacterium]|nr:NUDIX domain-containing protein [Phycisphaerae bacterium]
MQPKPFILSVKALIHDGHGRYLAIRRSAASKNNAGQWDFPGGKLDAGEAFDAALIREVAEETGLTVQLEQVLGAGESELPDRKVAYLFMLARARGGEVRLSEEHDAFAWMTADELAAADVCPQFRAMARRLAPGPP